MTYQGVFWLAQKAAVIIDVGVQDGRLLLFGCLGSGPHSVIMLQFTPGYTTLLVDTSEAKEGVVVDQTLSP